MSSPLKSAVFIPVSSLLYHLTLCRVGGGFLIFGILVLSVEHDRLKLFGQAAEFVLVLGILDALQAKMEGLF